MDIDSTIKNIYDSKMSVINKIYDMFIMYYGEQNVDLDDDNALDFVTNQIHELHPDIKDDHSVELLDEIENRIYDRLSMHRPSIKIHWPYLTITNENGNSIDIYDLFCTIYIGIDGTLYCIDFVKSTYTDCQFNLGYKHSHLKPVRYYEYYDVNKNIDDLRRHEDFCFGSGPIRNTLSTLRNIDSTNNEGVENIYFLLCRELDICVRIESLAGVPYIRMSSLKAGSKLYLYNRICSNDEETTVIKPIRNFVRYLLEKIDLDYSFNGSNFELGCSFEEFSIYVTKKFIEYVKSNKDHLELKDIKSLLSVVTKNNGRFYIDNYQNNNMLNNLKEYISNNEVEIIRFKDRQFNLKVIEDPVNVVCCMRLLNPHITSYIWDLILLMINSEIDFTQYGRNKPKELSDGEETSDEHAQVRYGFSV